MYKRQAVKLGVILSFVCNLSLILGKKILVTLLFFEMCIRDSACGTLSQISSHKRGGKNREIFS